jgi:hypothetical protein
MLHSRVIIRWRRSYHKLFLKKAKQEVDSLFVRYQILTSHIIFPGVSGTPASPNQNSVTFVLVSVATIVHAWDPHQSSPYSRSNNPQASTGKHQSYSSNYQEHAIFIANKRDHNTCGTPLQQTEAPPFVTLLSGKKSSHPCNYRR